MGGQKVIPLEVSSKLLFDQWRLGDEEPEFTIMRISIGGTNNDQPKTIVYDLLDRYDPQTKTSSMARTTGYTCTAAANLFLDGHFHRKGICPPEFIGEKKEFVEYILDYLKERKVIYNKKEN